MFDRDDFVGSLVILVAVITIAIALVGGYRLYNSNTELKAQCIAAGGDPVYLGRHDKVVCLQKGVILHHD